MATERFYARGLMYESIKNGFSFNQFYRDAKSKDLSYNRNDMAADFREVRAEVENARMLKDVAAGEIPPHVDVSSERIAYTEPYIYKARVGTQFAFGGPITDKYVTILSPEALTMEEVEEQVNSKWGGWEYGKAERVVQIEPMVALHRVD